MTQNNYVGMTVNWLKMEQRQDYFSQQSIIFTLSAYVAKCTFP